MKRIIFFLVTFLAIKVSSQSITFTRSIPYQMDQIISSICETNDRGYIAVGRRFFGNNITQHNFYIVKLDSIGKVVDSLFDSDTLNSTQFLEIFKYKNYYVCLGSKQKRVFPYVDSIIMLRLDDNLNILERKSYYLSDSLSVSQIQSRSINDTVFYAFANTVNFYQNTGSFRHGTIIKMDTNFSIIHKNDSLSNFPDFNVQYFDYSKFYDKAVVICRNYSVNFHSYVLILNYNLSVDSGFSFSQNNYQRFYSITELKDSSIVFLSPEIMNGVIQQVNLLRADKKFLLISSEEIMPIDTSQMVPAYQHRNHKRNYVALTYNVNPYDAFYGGGVRSYFRVQKYNDSFNIVFDKKYGGDAYYFLSAMIETSDGGCILTGSRYDMAVNTNYNRDIFFLKLDSLGNTTWVRNIPVPKIGILLYPNPATSILNISLEAQGESIASLRIFDNAGRTLYFSKPGKAKAAINIKSYATGVYFLEGRTAKGETFVRKFVKE